jgi:hypothetical protein
VEAASATAGRAEPECQRNGNHGLFPSDSSDNHSSDKFFCLPAPPFRRF